MRIEAVLAIELIISVLLFLVQGIKTVQRVVVNKGKEKYKDGGKEKEREKYSLIVEGWVLNQNF